MKSMSMMQSIDCLMFVVLKVFHTTNVMPTISKSSNPSNKSSNMSSTPTEYWQELTVLNYTLKSYAPNKSVYHGVLQHFVRASDSWAILDSEDLPENSGLQVLYDSIADLLGIEDIATGQCLIRSSSFINLALNLFRTPRE